MTAALAQPPAPPVDNPATCAARYHGTSSAYTKHRCRCPRARVAHSRRDAHSRAGLIARNPAWVPSAPTERRLRALAYLGHGSAQLAAALGWSEKNVRDTRNGRQRQLHRRRAAEVLALYSRWRCVPGLDTRTHRVAVARHWPPPAAWADGVFDLDDPTAPDDPVWSTRELDPAARRVLRDERAAQLAATAPSGSLEALRPPIDRPAVLAVIRGQRALQTVHPAHRWVVVHGLRAAGLSTPAIAARARCSTRMVRQHLADPPAGATL